MPRRVLTTAIATALNTALTALAQPLVAVEQDIVQESWYQYYVALHATTAAVVNTMEEFPEERSIPLPEPTFVLPLLDPLAIALNIDNLAFPPGGVGYLITSTVLVDREITGIFPPPAGHTGTIWFFNETDKHLKFKDQDSGSQAERRFKLPDASDYTLNDDASMQLYYRSDRWKVYGGKS